MVDDILAIQKFSSKSLKLNKAINTFIDMEKLTLSKKKCNNIHVGKQNKECPALTIHGNEMKNSKQETYLGDIVHESGSIIPTIEKRKSKGYGITSEILAIINEIPLAQWRTEAGLTLRQAMLVNGTLFDSEAWHDLTKKDVVLLKKVDLVTTQRTPTGSPKDATGGSVSRDKSNTNQIYTGKPYNHVCSYHSAERSK